MSTAGDREVRLDMRLATASTHFLSDGSMLTGPFVSEWVSGSSPSKRKTKQGNVSFFVSRYASSNFSTATNT
jgi:hypothetical protein